MSQDNFEILCGLAEAYELGGQMTKEMLVEYLKQNLRIQVNVGLDDKLHIELLLENEVISQDKVSLPNRE